MSVHSLLSRRSIRLSPVKNRNRLKNLQSKRIRVEKESRKNYRLSFGFLFRLRILIIGDQQTSPFAFEIRAGPLPKNRQPVSKRNQKLQVNHQPEHPCEKSGKTPFPNFSNRAMPADCRHYPAISIPKRNPLASLRRAQNNFCNRFSLLHRSRSES